jgi:diguanylate cyclase
MVTLQNLNISHKLTLMAVASATVALICVVVAFIVQDFQLVKRVKAEQVESQLSVLSSNLVNAIKRNDALAVAELLQNSATVHGIVAASVHDQQGVLIAQYPIAEVGKVVAVEMEFDYPTRIHNRPIFFESQSLGQLQVLVSYADVRMRAIYMAAYSALAFCFAVCIAGILAWLVQKNVSQPLIQLYQLSRDVMETGNYKLRTDVSSGDELGKLAQAFNQMLSQIEQRDTMMERQVKARTQELQKLAEEFRYLALHDSLTGLPNRALLNEEFNRAAAHARRAGKSFALLLLDLDNFKIINDTYGHQVGDDLLKWAAAKIRSALREEDVVCRVGGDEFVIILENVQTNLQIDSIGQVLINAIGEGVPIQGVIHKIGVSMGASLFPEQGEDLATLKLNADMAMYSAKSLGKNQLVIFETRKKLPWAHT